MKLHLLAFALVVVSQQASAEGIHVHSKQQNERGADAKRTSDAGKKSAAPPTTIAPTHATVDSQPKADPQTGKSNNEGSEYWPWRPFGFRLKVTDSLLVVFTGLLFAVGTVQSVVMIAQIKLARAEFLATHRPWLIVQVEVASDLEWSVARNVNGRLRVSLTVKNIGESPARLVQGNAVLHSGHHEDGDVLQLQERFAGAFQMRGIEFGRALFPNDSTTLDAFVVLLSPDRTASWGEWIKQYDGMPDIAFVNSLPPAYIVGCVAYASTFGKHTFQTGFIRELTRISYPDQSRAVMEPKRGNVPQGELRLANSTLGDGVIT
jgi:hypothetical protein